MKWRVLPGQGVYYHVFVSLDRETGERLVVETGGYVTDVITSFCIDFQKRHDNDQPFALFCRTRPRTGTGHPKRAGRQARRARLLQSRLRAAKGRPGR